MEDRVNGNLKVKSKVWLENGVGNTVIGDGRFRILKAIRDTGSISKAAVRIKQPFGPRLGKGKRRGGAMWL